MEECPICLLEMKPEDVSQVGCCRKTFHLECIVKCFSAKLECPMCRAEYSSLSTHRVETKLVIVQKNKDFFKNAFVGTVAMSVLIVSLGGHWACW